LFIRCGSLLHSASRSFSRRIPSDDIVGMAQLCLEVIPASTLVFCPSRLQAFKCALQLGAAIASDVQQLHSRYVYKPATFCKDKALLHNPANIVEDCVMPPAAGALHARREGLIADLIACGTSLSSAARAAIAAGVCFHHGGMAPDARRIVEAALRDRVICVLCCTTALAAGVNFPARRVLVAAPMVGQEQMTHDKFVQICGRAGRYGYDSIGEAVLFCSAETSERGWNLVTSGHRTTVCSALRFGMDRFLLEMVCCCSAARHPADSSCTMTLCGGVSLDELQSIVQTSLHARSLLAVPTSTCHSAAPALENSVIEQLKLLQHGGFVVMDDAQRVVRATAKGSAVFVSGMSLTAATQLHCDLSAVGLSCSFEFYLLYVLVPQQQAHLPRFDWQIIHDVVWPSLDPSILAAAAVLKLEERWVYLLAYSKAAAAASADNELRMRRFLCACLLNQMLVSSNAIASAARFRVDIGALHALQEVVGAHAACVSEYSRMCGMWCLHSMCVAAVQRLRSGGGSELQSLSEIRSCTAPRARALLAAGITCPLHVVKAGEDTVLDALARACGAQPHGIARAIVQHAEFLIGQEVKLLQRRVQDLQSVRPR
jgi:hypothetical protein